MLNFPTARFFLTWFCIGINLVLLSIAFQDRSYADDASRIPLLDGVDSDNHHHRLPARYALVIGIDRYSQPRKLDLHELPSAINDAINVAKVLRDKASFNVTLLTPFADPENENDRGKYKPITRAEILFSIGNLASIAKASKNETQRNPIVLVYFAGHGLSDDKDDYIVPADFNPFFAEDVPEMSVSVAQILARLQDANPSLRILITDSCRNPAPVNLESVDQIKVTFQPGGSYSGSHKAIGGSENGSALIYATLKEHFSSSDGDSGRFTGEFVSIMNNVFNRINSSGAEASSTGANLSQLYHSTQAVMNAKTSVAQIPEQAGSGPDFDFFPTKADFDLEKGSWEAARKLAAISVTSELDLDVPRYCLMKQFVENNSPTSFYGEDAVNKLRNLERLLTQSDGVSENDLKSICSEGGSLKTVAIAAPAAAPSPTVAAATLPPVAAAAPPPAAAAPPPAAPPPPAAAAPWLSAARVGVAAARPSPAAAPPASIPLGRIRVSDVMRSPSLSVEAKQELADFDPATIVDSLAVTVAPTKVFAAATANAAVVTTVDAQIFVQVLAANGPYANIRTAKGRRGFVEQKLLGSAIILHARDLTFSDGKLDRDCADKLSTLLKRVLPIDALVQYRSDDGAKGLARAQDVALQLSQSQLSATSTGTFIPKISGSESLPSQTVRLTITAFALDKQARESPDVIVVPNAIALTGQSVPIQAQSVPVAVAKQATAAVLKENAQAPGCDNLAAGLEGSDKGTLAYIQYDGSKDQYALSARILATLTDAGFHKAALQTVELPRLPRDKGEVRRCPQFPESLTTAAVSALRTCGLGEYKPVTLPASICQRASTQNIEVWLARPASN